MPQVLFEGSLINIADVFQCKLKTGQTSFYNSYFLVKDNMCYIVQSKNGWTMEKEKSSIQSIYPLKHWIIRTLDVETLLPAEVKAFLLLTGNGFQL